ncbi:hypothetical protein FRX31_035202 [Thalictrum thalictroides]|uniref:Uncharacterized protein n=1 Tax=Thalictrum thalictroides TaxID=46969 RepID=A0A7J6USG7_THATH|nr:hypothetical protein FRX31_035202 [Thalictrum thalictroides]
MKHIVYLTANRTRKAGTMAVQNNDIRLRQKRGRFQQGTGERDGHVSFYLKLGSSHKSQPLEPNLVTISIIKKKNHVGMYVAVHNI